MPGGRFVNLYYFNNSGWWWWDSFLQIFKLFYNFLTHFKLFLWGYPTIFMGVGPVRSMYPHHPIGAYLWYIHCLSTVKSRFNESQFNVKSRFKVWNLVANIQFHIKKSHFSVKSRFKEPKCADWGHSLNRDFTVLLLARIIIFIPTKHSDLHIWAEKLLLPC